MSREVRELLGRAITRLLSGDRARFEKLAIKADEKHKRDRHLYVTIGEILTAKRMMGRGDISG
ncbi:MAG TPA: hypothetical protein VFD33_02415 [Bacillota bacterium]|nr:hypothetical protein [Bacillota bacterium]